MKTSKWRLLIAVFLAFTLLAAACGDDDEDETATTPEATDGDDMSEPEEEMSEPEEEMALPGEGITVRMARGNWAETNFQNTVVQKLLIELGYDVPTP